MRTKPMVTTVELPPDVKRDLEDLARRSGRTEAEIVVEAVERHLAAVARPRPQAIGVYDDPEVTGENYEEWLAANWKSDRE
jgi:hypothetical protein